MYYPNAARYLDHLRQILFNVLKERCVSLKKVCLENNYKYDNNKKQVKYHLRVQ